MLVRIPTGVDPLRVAAASDNLADAWRSVVPALRERPGGSVLVIDGGAQSIGTDVGWVEATEGGVRELNVMHVTLLRE